MTRRERLMATLRGEPVDRPPVSFYEISGYRQDVDNPDPYNIYNDPSWRPLMQLAREKSDLIAMRGMRFRETGPSPLGEPGQERNVGRREWQPLRPDDPQRRRADTDAGDAA